MATLDGMTTSLIQLTADHYDTAHWDGPPFPFFPLIPLIIFGTIFFFASRRFRGGRHDATATVRRLYAEGQITDEQMRERLTVLKATKR